MIGDVQHRFRKIDAIIIQSTNKLDKERGGECNHQSHQMTAQRAKRCGN